MRRLLTLAGCLLVAACSSGESILNAGNDPLPTTTATTVPSTPPGSTLPGQTTTTASTVAETTTTTPLASLAPCPVDALEGASAPVEITFWYGLATEVEGHLVS